MKNNISFPKMCKRLTDVTQNHFHPQGASVSKVNCPNKSLMDTFIEDGMIYLISDHKIFSLSIIADKVKYDETSNMTKSKLLLVVGATCLPLYRLFSK
jgi:hypothetical protein